MYTTSISDVSRGKEAEYSGTGSTDHCHAPAYAKTQTQVQALNHSSIYSAFNNHISSLTFIMCTQVVILWVLMCLLDKYK